MAASPAIGHRVSRRPSWGCARSAGPPPGPLTSSRPRPSSRSTGASSSAGASARIGSLPAARCSTGRYPHGISTSGRSSGSWRLRVVEALLIGGLLIQRARRRHAESALDERLRFETLLADLSAILSHLPAGEVERQIDLALRRLVEGLGVDRASLAEVTPDTGLARFTHSWALDGVTPAPSAVERGGFPWMVERVQQGHIVFFARLDEPAARGGDGQAELPRLRCQVAGRDPLDDRRNRRRRCSRAATSGPSANGRRCWSTDWGFSAISSPMRCRASSPRPPCSRARRSPAPSSRPCTATWRPSTATASSSRSTSPGCGSPGRTEEILCPHVRRHELPPGLAERDQPWRHGRAAGARGRRGRAGRPSAPDRARVCVPIRRRRALVRDGGGGLPAAPGWRHHLSRRHHAAKAGGGGGPAPAR